MRQTPLLSECIPPTLNAKVAKESDPKEAAECARRLNEAFNQLFVPATGAARSDVVVCHGDVIRYFVMKALGVDTKAWLGMSVAHASLSVNTDTKLTSSVRGAGVRRASTPQFGRHYVANRAVARKCYM